MTRAVAVAATLCSASAATGHEWFDETLSHCLEAEDSIEAVVEPLVGLGWQPVGADDVSEAEAAELAMVYLARYAAGAAPPDLPEAYEQQKRTVRGVLRKRDIPQSRSRFLRWESEGGTDLLMVAWRGDGTVTTECRVAFEDADGRIAALAEAAHGRPLDELGDVVHLDLRPTGTGGPAVSLTLFDSALALPADVTMETFISEPH